MSTAEKKISRRFIALFMACLMALSCAGCGGVQNSDDGKTDEGVTDDGHSDSGVTLQEIAFPNAIEQYNLVLLLDTSGSVNEADPERKAMDAACMFLDSLFMAGTEGKNRQGVPKTTVGVVAYNDKAETVQVISEVPSENSIVTLKKKIYSLDCPNGSGDAGLGDAVYKAVNMLNEINPLSASFMPPMPPMRSTQTMQKNMIVLFTDGYAGTLPSGNASASMSAPEQPFQPNPGLLPNFGAPVQERLTEGLNLAFSSQTEIFVVGLDVGGIGAQWKQFRNIANYTQTMGGMPPPPPPGMPGNAGGMSPVSDMGEMPPMPGGMPPPPPPGMPEITAGNSGIFKRDADDNPQDLNGMPIPLAATGVNYYRATSIVQVQYFYVQLLASLMQGSGAKSKMPDQPNEWSNYYVDVNAAGNSALLFFLLSENVIAGMRLFNPEGKEIDLNHPDKNGWNADKTVRLQWWKGYTTLSVMDPEQGTWVIMAKDERGINDFQAQYILVGGLILELTVLRSENQNSLSSARVRLQAVYRGTPVDEAFYQNAECACEVFQVPLPLPQFNPAGQAAPAPVRNGAQGMASQETPAPGAMSGPPPMIEPQSVALAYNKAAQAMEGSFNAETPGDYQVRGSVNSSEVSYSVEKSVSLMPGTPRTISFSGQGDKKNLTPALIGWDSLSITVESWSVEPEGLLSVALNGDGSLALQAQQNGTGALSVIVYSSPKNSAAQQLQRWNLSYPIQVG